jgi:hypothetical protein
MGLEQTQIKDRSGPALYILYDGREQQKIQLMHFADEVNKSAHHQVVLLSVKDQDGEKVRDFYDFGHEKLPVVFIVQDDDQLAHIWHGIDGLNASDVAYQLNQTGV